MKEFNDKEFFDYEMSHGMNPEDENYVKLQSALGHKIISDLKPESVLEIGPGSGALLEYFIRNQIDVFGIDKNPYHHKYFCTRNPVYVHNYYLYNMEDGVLDVDFLFDVGVSIETFEHMSDVAIRNSLELIKKSCKHWFVFSSTPHPDPEFDVQWGHINVKSKDEWISLFEEYDMKIHSEWKVPTEWTLLFRII